MIHAEGLARDFGTTRALDGVSFDVAPGEVYGLLGPNGAGKTTAMRLLSGLLRPSAGSATVCGFAVEHQPREIRARVGLLTEVPGLYLRLTPSEYLDFFAQLHGLRAAAARRTRIEEMLELVGLWERRNDGMRAFSKGMQQRVAIARTLLHAPPVLLLDEPTAALDPEAARKVRDHVQELAVVHGRTVLLSTHNLHEAELLCQRLSIVQAGRQIVEGRPADLRRRAGQSCILHLRSLAGNVLDRVRDVPGVLSASTNGTATVTYVASDPVAVNPAVVRAAVNAGADVVSLVQEEPTLEQVYLSLISQPRITHPALAPSRSPNVRESATATSGNALLLVCRRELREILRDSNMLLPLLVLPILIGVMAGLTSFASFGSPTGSVGTAVTTAALDRLPPAAVERLSNVPSDNRMATLETLIKAFSIPLFWVIPVALAPAVAADSFVGERERFSLEPLLSTPVRMRHVLLGKLIASAVPAMLGAWLGVLVFWVLTALSRSPLYSRVLLTDRDWLFSLVVVTPLVALFTSSVAALISTRVSGYRAAYQLNGLVALPLVLIVIPAAAFGFLLSPWALVNVALGVAALTLLLIAWALRLYDRERLLSRR